MIESESSLAISMDDIPISPGEMASCNTGNDSFRNIESVSELLSHAVSEFQHSEQSSSPINSSHSSAIMSNCIPEFDLPQSKSTIILMPFNNKDENLSVTDFYHLYDLMADANCWSDKDKYDQLYFNLADCPQKECKRLMKELKDYQSLKQKMIELFSKRLFDVERMFSRKFNQKIETFIDYFCEKQRLISHVEPNMSLKLRRALIIKGLEPILRREVLMTETEDQTLEELLSKTQHIIEVLNLT